MKLYSEDFFITPQQHIAVEPRAPQSVFPEHTHDFSEIFLVEKGLGLHVLNGRPHTLCPGMICYIKSSDYHLFDDVSNLNLTNILYRSDSSFTYLNNINHLFPFDSDSNVTHWLLNKEHCSKAKRIIDKLNDSDDSDPIYTESLFLQLIVNLYKGRYNPTGEGSNEQRIIQMLRWLSVNFTENIDWECLTTQFSVSLRTFHRYMKNSLGISPQNYLIKLRLSEAYYQIRFSDKTITDIALESGFNDSAYFSTRFKSEYNCTPRDLRHCQG